MAKRKLNIHGSWVIDPTLCDAGSLFIEGPAGTVMIMIDDRGMTLEVYGDEREDDEREDEERLVGSLFCSYKSLEEDIDTIATGGEE
jgi:hypothetical protein